MKNSPKTLIPVYIQTIPFKEKHKVTYGMRTLSEQKIMSVSS